MLMERRLLRAFMTVLRFFFGLVLSLRFACQDTQSFIARGAMVIFLDSNV